MSWYLDVKVRESWAYAPNCFTAEECDSIIDLGSKLNLKKGVIEEGDLKDEIRKSDVAFFYSQDQSVSWIFRRVTDFVNSVNRELWGYDLQYIEPLQFTTYKNQNDFYGKHIDQVGVSPNYRKLSFSVQLSDPNTYKGADLLMYFLDKPTHTNNQRGNIIFFPSFVLHEVTPLISGERYSLVGWVCGPPFK